MNSRRRRFIRRQVVSFIIQKVVYSVPRLLRLSAFEARLAPFKISSGRRAGFERKGLADPTGLAVLVGLENRSPTGNSSS